MPHRCLNAKARCPLPMFCGRSGKWRQCSLAKLVGEARNEQNAIVRYNSMVLLFTTVTATAGQRQFVHVGTDCCSRKEKTVAFSHATGCHCGMYLALRNRSTERFLERRNCNHERRHEVFKKTEVAAAKELWKTFFASQCKWCIVLTVLIEATENWYPHLVRCGGPLVSSLLA